MAGLALTGLKRWTIAAIVILAIAAAVWIIGSSPSTSAARPETVRMGYQHIVSALPLFVAEEKGFFKEEGIEIEEFKFDNSNLPVEAMATGRLDAIVTNSLVPALAAEAASPGNVKIFAVIRLTTERPFDAVVVKNNSSIKALGDLAGKRVGVYPGTTAMRFLQQHLKNNGVSIERMQFVQLTPANQLGALESESVDAAYVFEPIIAIAKSKGYRQVDTVFAKVFDKNPVSVSLASSRFAKEKPNTASKVIRALKKAQEYIAAHENEARAIAARRLGFDENVAREFALNYPANLAQGDAERINNFASFLYEMGELKQRVNTNGMLYTQ